MFVFTLINILFPFKIQEMHHGGVCTQQEVAHETIAGKVFQNTIGICLELAQFPVTERWGKGVR